MSRVEELATRLLRAEERLAQARKMETLGRLAGGIAHDFNNLLTGILGYASFLRTLLPEGGDGHEAAVMIERSARRASELTRRLLEFSRREPATLHPVGIHQLLGEAIGILSRSVGKGVEIRTELRAPSDLVMGDPEALLQAVLNLGINAGEAMPGGGLLTFATGPFASDGSVTVGDVPVPEGEYVEVSVSDTGCGIPESVRGQVFAPFFTTKAPGEGAGLGLPLVRAAVRGHGGFLHMESREGAGTTVRILLPAAQASGDP